LLILNILKNWRESPLPHAFRQSIAFWLAPDGVTHYVPVTHIQFVIDHPDLFSVSLEELHQRYQINNEPWGCEGTTRDEAIRELIVNGWTRVRRYARDYSVNVPVLSEHHRTILSRFARMLLNEGYDGRYEADVYMPMRIMEMASGKVSTETIQQVS
jgi:hypothetical protein